MDSDTPTPINRWEAQPPSSFDIVACYFPTNDGSLSKLRPALVLDVYRSRKGNRTRIRVAYGTKTLKIIQRQNLDLIIQNASDLRQMGLAVATRFDLDAINIVDLPWTHEYFGCWTGNQHPRIGRLTEAYIKEYAYVMMLRLGD